MKPHTIETMISEEEILKKVKELGARITKDYSDSKKLICIGVLKGSVVFMSDLIRNIGVPMKIDFLSASSYGNSMESSGVVRILKDISEDIEGYDVILIEDIVDTGLTLDYVEKFIKNKGANSVKICTLLDKPAKRKSKVKVEYIGFEIPDEFVVGYGIDYAEHYRELPYIGKVTLL